MSEINLPSATAHALAILRDESERRRDKSGRLLEQAHDARRQRSAAETALLAMVGAQGIPGFEGYPATKSQIAAANEKVAAAKAEESRRFDLHRAHREETEPVTSARARVERYLTQADVVRGPLLPHPGAVTPKRRAGETPLAAVTRVRRDIETLKGELAAVAARPLPAKDAKAAARRQVEALAAANVPDVAPLFAGEPFKVPVFDLRRGSRGGEPIAYGVPDGMSFLAWTVTDAIIAKLEKAIDAAADDRNALTAERKAAETKRLEAEVLAAERAEAALIEAAHAEGQTIHIRQDADPRAVLWLAASMAAPK